MAAAALENPAVVEARKRLQRGPLSSVLRTDQPVGPLTTYRVGGRASLFVEIGTSADLELVASVVSAVEVDVLVLGRGSNLLVSDAGFHGLAIVLGEGFAAIDVDGTTVSAGAAAALPVVARQTVAAGLTGFEWAVGVPGSIGGAIRMNAGGHGSDIAASLVAATVVDLRAASSTRRVARDLDLGYRTSSIAAHDVVVSAELELTPGDPERGRAELAEIVRWRMENQPGGQNAGSVFTNPVGASAGALIDAAGAKGRRHGSAHVSPKHANFFQADQGGSADDMFALMVEVARMVRRTHGVELQPETRLVGFPSWPDAVAEP